MNNTTGTSNQAPPIYPEENAEFERENAEISLQQRIELQRQLNAVEQQVGRFKIQES